MPRKKKNENLEKTPSLKKVANLLKINGAKYNTLDVNEYKKFLDSLTINGLYDEALRCGLKAYGERTLTTRTLIDLFNQYCALNVPNYKSAGIDTAKLSEEKKAKILDLMKDAR